jgi:hypothetical protein
MPHRAIARLHDDLPCFWRRRHDSVVHAWDNRCAMKFVAITIASAVFLG